MEGTKEILEALLKYEGIHEALIVGRDGFVIEHAGDMEADVAGAVMSTVVGSVESMGRDLESGTLFWVMAEYDEGTIIVSTLGDDALLGVSANKKANLGAVRHAVRKHRPLLEAAL